MKFENIPTWPEWKQASSSTMQIRALKPKLARIDELVRKYHQVLDMSKLNILMELKNAIIAWAADKIDRGADTGRLEAMQALEQVVIRKLYELDGWGKQRYLKVVCIGYAIATGPYGNAKPPDEKARQRAETVDIGSRCGTLAEAIRTAYRRYESYVSNFHIPAAEDSRILKIFMAPEFYFRGPYGAYRDIGWSAKILSMMRTETGKPQYADWLFVHGTAVFSTEKMVGGKSAGVLLENFALVQKGGPKHHDRQDFYVEKEFPSHVDFEHPTMSDWDWYKGKQREAEIAGTVRTAFRPEGGRKDPVEALGATVKSASELAGGAIFTMDGITFGLEVCRDHYMRRLAHSRENGRALIQLIPSCGVDEIQDASISCVPDGVVFNVDGGYQHAKIKLNSVTLPPHEVAPAVMSGGGAIRLFEAAKIPWPGLVRSDVADRLKLRQSVLSGTAPIPPPKPAELAAAAKK